MSLLVLALFLCLNRQEPRRIVLANGRELQVLKVSRGTNHLFIYESDWRQKLRQIAPGIARKFYGPGRTQSVTTHHDSMVIWVKKVPSDSPAFGFDQPDRFEALLSDEVVANGERRPEALPMVMAVEFRQFRRDLTTVPLQLCMGTNIFPFTVRNPSPAPALAWHAQPLAQTNVIAQTKIVLKAASPRLRVAFSNHFRIQINAYSTSGDRIGWMTWRGTAFDALGNWSEPVHSFYSGGGLELGRLFPSNAPLKIRAQGREYISAGKVSRPTAGAYQICSIDGRARSLGVNFLTVLGPGDYAITNGVITAWTNGQSPGALANMAFEGIPGLTTRGLLPARETLRSIENGTNWILIAILRESSVICRFSANSEADINARIRERTGDRNDRIFPGTRTSLKAGALSSTRFLEIPIPSDAATLEAEIIATLPTTEFIVDPTQLTPP